MEIEGGASRRVRSPQGKPRQRHSRQQSNLLTTGHHSKCLIYAVVHLALQVFMLAHRLLQTQFLTELIEHRNSMLRSILKLLVLHGRLLTLLL